MGHCLFMRKGETHTIPGQYNITVTVSDAQGYLNTLIVQRGVLTVAGQEIKTERTELVVDNTAVIVAYKMTGSISTARTMKINGEAIGTIGTAGDSLTKTILVQNGDTIVIEFV